MTRKIARLAGRLAEFVVPAQRRIAVGAIYGRGIEDGRKIGDAEGYERGWKDCEALTLIARQPSAPAREAATA